jgi:hypothetical protein
LRWGPGSVLKHMPKLDLLLRAHPALDVEVVLDD